MLLKSYQFKGGNRFGSSCGRLNICRGAKLAVRVEDIISFLCKRRPEEAKNIQFSR